MKRVNVLRKLKYMLNKKTLMKMYNCFISPILEYACEVWDGCTLQESNVLESVQLEAARIITGLPIFCKTDFYIKSSYVLSFSLSLPLPLVFQVVLRNLNKAGYTSVASRHPQ